MDQAIKVAKFAAFSSLAFFLITLSVAVGDIRLTLNDLARNVQGVTDKAGTELITLNASTSAISGQTVATLKQVGATAAQVKTTVASLKPSVDELHAVLEESHSLVYDARASISEVNRTTLAERKVFEESIPELLTSANKDIVDAGDTLTAGKTLIADPNLKRILANSGDMMDSGKKILADAQFEAEKFAHPPKKKLTFWTATEAGGDYARHFMPPIF